MSLKKIIFNILIDLFPDKAYILANEYDNNLYIFMLFFPIVNFWFLFRRSYDTY